LGGSPGFAASPGLGGAAPAGAQVLYDTTSVAWSLADAVELAGTIGALLAVARPLAPSDLVLPADSQAAARALKPFYEHNTLGKSLMYYEGVDRPALAGLGELHTPSITDLFVAKLSGGAA